MVSFIIGVFLGSLALTYSYSSLVTVNAQQKVSIEVRDLVIRELAEQCQ